MWTGIDSLALLLFVLHQILPLVAMLMALSGLDDLFVDLAYVYRRIWRYFQYYRHQPRMTAQQLSDVPVRPIAVMIPAWDESDVIESMLRSTTTLWPQPNIHFFVGVYRNDPATLQIVRNLEAVVRRIHLVFVNAHGPTTKAHCLNEIAGYIGAWEAHRHMYFDAFLWHDAEDLVSAREPYVISHLIGRKDILQFPVRPLQVPGSRWVSGHYLDEFAESHGKDLQVREFLGACLPSAGVGCAISRRAFLHVACARAGRPFDETSVTEDYELALRLGKSGYQTSFVHLSAGPAAPYVATEEYFPDSFWRAVRQKSRWLLGITLQGWDRLGWSGGWANRYMLLRDRKALLTAYLNTIAFILAAVFSSLWIWQQLDADAPHFMVLVPQSSPVHLLLLLNGYLVLHRMIVRGAFVWRYHGARQALLSVPRTFVANSINFAAACRAILLYRRHRRTKIAIAWDKTAHRFPVAA